MILKYNINSLDYLDQHSGIFKFGVNTHLHNFEAPEDLSLAFDIVVKTKGTQFLATFVDKTYLNSRKTGKRPVFIFKKKTGDEYVKIDPSSIEKIEFKDVQHEDYRISLEELELDLRKIISDKSDDRIMVELSYLDNYVLSQQDSVPISPDEEYERNREISYTEKPLYAEGKYKIELGLYSDFVESMDQRILWKEQYNKPLGFIFYVKALEELANKIVIK